MYSPAALLILSFTLRALPVLSLAYPGPKPTDAASNIPDSNGWTPKPTTAAFANTPLELHRRTNYAPINTCGWFDGNAAYPFACANGNACSANGGAAYFGCCQTDAAGNYVASDCAYIATGYTNCYDYTVAPFCTGLCYEENRVCDASYPYCGKATVNLGSEVLTNYGCYESVYVRALDVETTVLYTSSFGASASASSTLITSSLTVNNNAFSSSTPSISNTGSLGPSSSLPPSSSTSSTLPTTKTPISSPNHAGAIAGGVVGGLAALAVLVGGAIFWLHKRKQREMRVAAPEVSQTM